MAPVAGWNPDGNPWDIAETQAPILDNALIRPGRIAVRGSLTNWADLSGVTSPAPPLNVCGVQPVPGSTELVLGRKVVSATAFVDPWFAPIVRPATSAALAAPGPNNWFVVGGTSFVGAATPADSIPGPRGIDFEGSRYYISYGTATSPVQDAGGSYWAQTTSLNRMDASHSITLFTNAPRGFIDIKGYQSRIWGLGGIDDPGSGTTFSPLALFFTNPIGPGGGNAASFADWKDPVSGLTNKILMDGDTTDPGVGLATVRNGLLIFRQNSVWILRGSTTANYTLTPVSRQAGCVDPRSIVETDKGIYFMSTQGWMLTDGVSVRNASGVALHTLQSAVEVVIAAIQASFGGYVTCTVASGGQLVLSMGIASVTAGAPDGHIQPVWCGMYDPDSNAWTRITSALFTTDGSIIVPGNNYPGWVFNTPDNRLLSIGDKYVTQWEAAVPSSALSTLNAADFPTAVTNDATVGAVAWTNPTNAAASDSVYATAADGTNSSKTTPGTVIQSSSGGTVWTIPSGGNLAGIVSQFGLPFSNTVEASNWGFAIPAGATITGLQADVNRASQDTFSQSIPPPSGGVIDAGVFLVSGATVSSNKLSGASWPGTAAVATYGGPGDLWGASWAPSDINSSNFMCNIDAQIPTSNAAAQIVSIHITVYYSLGTELLKATGYAFAIPSTGTITGIQVNALRKSGTGVIVDTHARVYKAGALQTANRSTGAAWSTSPATTSFGGSSDLWGTTWAPADINNAGFGAAIAARTSAGADTASVDLLSITVFYTVPNVVHQQSFVKQPALYDTDAAGNFQPIPFRWLTRLFPIVGTTTLTRKFGQMKRFFIDYIFQGIGLPSTNGFTVKAVDATGTLIQGSSPAQLPPTNNSMTSSSISGGQPNASTSIERANTDMFSEVSDLAFDVTWTDAQQSTQPSFVASEIYGIGIEYQPARDLR